MMHLLSRTNRDKYNIFEGKSILGFLKTGLAKTSSPFTTWQFKTIRNHPKPDQKPLADAGREVNGP